MMENVLNWIYYICAMACMVMVGEWTYHWTTRDVRKWVVAAGIYVVGFLVGIVLFPDKLVYANLLFIAEIWAWSLICEEKLTVKIVRIVVLMIVVGIVESVMSTAVDIVLGGLISRNTNKIGCIWLAFIAFFLITRANWYQRLIVYLGSLSKGKRIVIICAIILGLAVAVFGSVVQEMLDNRNLTVFFRVLVVVDLIVVIGIIVWLIVESYQKKYYEEQNDIKAEYIQMQKEYYKSMYDKEQEMRRFRHDVANHMGVLSAFLEKGEIEAAKRHLGSLYQEFSQAGFKKIRVGNEILDTILSMMNQKAVENGVELKIKGEITGKNELDVYELCTILSNAISNAIEACQNMQGEKTVSVKLMKHNNSLCFVIENAATEDMYLAALKGETTKGDKMQHGYGVQNIRRAVERLNGSMEYRYADGKLELEINI